MRRLYPRLYQIQTTRLTSFTSRTSCLSVHTLLGGRCHDCIYLACTANLQGGSASFMLPVPQAYSTTRHHSLQELFESALHCHLTRPETTLSGRPLTHFCLHDDVSFVNYALGANRRLCWTFQWHLRLLRTPNSHCCRKLPSRCRCATTAPEAFKGTLCRTCGQAKLSRSYIRSISFMNNFSHGLCNCIQSSTHCRGSFTQRVVV